MAWKAVGEARFRSYSEYRDMFRNLTEIQALSTEQFLRIQELKAELKEKDEMLEKVMRIAFLLNPEGAKKLSQVVPITVQAEPKPLPEGVIRRKKVAGE